MTTSRHYGGREPLRPGRLVPPGSEVAESPASALVRAWRAADCSTCHRAPFVYRVVPSGSGLVVIGDLAWQAIELGGSADEAAL
jgi:hypothetical protein